MKNDPLQDLLCHADSAALPPVISIGLATRVRQRARRRDIRRSALLVTAAVIVCGVGISVARRSHPVATRAGMTPANVAEIRAELARLDADAQNQLRIVADLQQRQSHKTSPGSGLEYPTHGDVLDRVDQARNRTALILLRQADRAAGDLYTANQAGELYGRAARLFPDTPAGRSAAQRLKRPVTPT